MTTKKIREQILESFLENLYGISDKEYQKRVWVQGSGPEVDDYDETATDLLHEGEGILEAYKSFGIKITQYKKIKNFLSEFKKFSDDHDLPEEFIDTPEWARIMDMAKEVLKAFDYKKN